MINLNNRRDNQYLLEALAAAKIAKGMGNLPIAAVLVLPGYTLIDVDTVWSEGSFLNHAELNVMRKAVDLGYRNIKSGVLYSTVEPCAMCAAAAMNFGIKEIVFGAYDKENGFTKYNFPLTVQGGVLAEECIEILPKHLRESYGI